MGTVHYKPTRAHVAMYGIPLLSIALLMAAVRSATSAAALRPTIYETVLERHMSQRHSGYPSALIVVLIAIAKSIFSCLAIVLCAVTPSAMAADDFPLPLRGHWSAYARTIDEPRHVSSMGPVLVVKNYGPRDEKSKRVVLEWFKAEYLKSQKLGDKTFNFEYQLIRIDCAHAQYRLLRDVKYSEDGTLVSDTAVQDKVKTLNIAFSGDSGVLPLDEEFATASTDFVCLDRNE